VGEVKAARDRLVYPGFLARTPWGRLEHVPRYLKGYGLRLAKYRTNAERDQKHSGTVAGLWNQYDARAKADKDAGRDEPAPGGIPLAHRGAARVALRAGAAHAASRLRQAAAEILG
jgi:hypothetical protein